MYLLYKTVIRYGKRTSFALVAASQIKYTKSDIRIDFLAKKEFAKITFLIIYNPIHTLLKKKFNIFVTIYKHDNLTPQQQPRKVIYGSCIKKREEIVYVKIQKNCYTYLFIKCSSYITQRTITNWLESRISNSNVLLKLSKHKT